MKVVSSRAFNQDVSQAKRLAKEQPVFVTDRGQPTHVLLSYESFRHLVQPAEAITDQLALDDPDGPEPDWRALPHWEQ